MSRHRSRGRQAGSRTGYYWDGLQWGATALVTTGNVFELIGPTAQEFMPGTMTRIRGHIAVMPVGATAWHCNHKIMYVEVDDAGVMTGDHAAIDTHEEDIANRQLWTHVAGQRATATTDGADGVNVEVDVRVKVKLQASGKWILALLADVGANSTVLTQGYLRALIQHA